MTKHQGMLLCAFLLFCTIPFIHGSGRHESAIAQDSPEWENEILEEKVSPEQISHLRVGMSEQDVLALLLPAVGHIEEMGLMVFPARDNDACYLLKFWPDSDHQLKLIGIVFESDNGKKIILGDKSTTLPLPPEDSQIKQKPVAKTSESASLKDVSDIRIGESFQNAIGRLPCELLATHGEYGVLVKAQEGGVYFLMYGPWGEVTYVIYLPKGLPIIQAAVLSLDFQ